MYDTSLASRLPLEGSLYMQEMTIGPFHASGAAGKGDG
jgi:hypothetical protein